MLNQTCTIRRKSVTTASTGAKTVTWTNVATGVACAIQGAGSREDRTAERQDGVLTFTGYFAYGQDIRAEDQVLPTSGAASGLTLHVDGPAIDDAGRQAYTRVPLLWRRGGGVA